LHKFVELADQQIISLSKLRQLVGFELSIRLERPANVRYWGAGSNGRCNTGTNSFGWGLEALSLAGPFIKLPSYSVELRLRVHRHVGSLGKMLPQQPIGVLIGSTLPRTLRVAKVDVDLGRPRKPPMIGKLLALSPRARQPHAIGQPSVLPNVGTSNQSQVATNWSPRAQSGN
jgi:hypothetical protein